MKDVIKLPSQILIKGNLDFHQAKRLKHFIETRLSLEELGFKKITVTNNLHSDRTKWGVYGVFGSEFGLCINTSEVWNENETGS